jgi:hypothetical protein
MEPANGEGLGAFGGAVAMALIVAVVVLLMMVNIGGGLTGRCSPRTWRRRRPRRQDKADLPNSGAAR